MRKGAVTAVGPNFSSARHVNGVANGRTKVRPCCALLALLLGAVISAQQPQSRFRAGVDLVTVDVVVLDKEGNPVPGLTRQDFAVEEDGRLQQVTEFQSVELPPPSATPRPARPAPERRISFNSITAGHIAGRAFALVFDDINLTRVQAAEAKKALRTFVESAVTDEDSVSLITTSGGGWFHARTARDREKLLALADNEQGKYIEDTSAERMTDFEAMRITVFQDTTVAARVRRRYANYRVAGMQPVTTPGGVDDMPRIEEPRGNVGVVEPYIESRASGVYSQVVARNRMTLGVLERALKALEGTRGRKSVILLSKGFIYDPETRGFKDVSLAARRANVAIYFVDARGLVATTSNFAASEGSPIDARDIGAVYADIALDAEGAVSVAEDSGGFAIRNTNDLGAGLDRLARESRSYYLLGYVPPNPKADGKFRQISVKVKRPGLTVRARRGYFAPDASNAAAAPVTAELDPEVRRALDSPRDMADLPVRATALVFDRTADDTARVVVAADVDVKSFLFEPEEGGRSKGSVEFAVAATELATGQVFHFEQTTAMNLKADTRDRLGVTWYSMSREFPLPTGDYQARVVVRDRTSGRLGSVTHAFSVPPLTGFRVSSPILTDTLRNDPTGQTTPKPVLLARRTFLSGSTLYCQFTAYGAALDPGTGKPRVSGSWVLKRGDGSVVREAPATTLTPASDGSLARIYGISLAGLLPGDYELGLAVRDEVGVKIAELREPFTVDRAVGLSTAPGGASRP
jgi:VWFA-related protein